ncbi:hypothetical protein GO988_11300 [Hymenobacter sp. HMF4947]|uniref:Uncharacterized protein n=1 Tax=Hymenobacter ginkgonis TaxID=2682976 RepID=A0A7K1TES2_9BACT|nr:hypothetical protein [Hymenobacter ginkgonis]MVN76910.1 hypothetical protein [Hymenobacter ginkgonis]
MTTPLSTDRMKYYQLMALVCEDLTANTKAIDAMVRGGHEATSSQLMAVRFGRNVHLTWLIDLVRVILPTYSIPDNLLPAPTAPAVVDASLFQEASL